MDHQLDKKISLEKNIFEILGISKIQKNLSKEESEKYYESLKQRSIIIEKRIF